MAGDNDAPVAQPSSARIVATLGGAGLLSGLVLVSIFLATAPRIRQNHVDALRAAIFRVLPGTATIDTLVVRDGRLTVYDGPGGMLPDEPAIYAGSNASGEPVGYAIPADGPGFMDTIGLIYGFDLGRRRIVGLAVLESRETPGLGDRISSDAQFLANFDDLSVEPHIEPVRRGEKDQPNEVDTITGATISSEAVIAILNRSTQRWLPLLEDLAVPQAAAVTGGEETELER